MIKALFYLLVSSNEVVARLARGFLGEGPREGTFRFVRVRHGPGTTG